MREFALHGRPDLVELAEAELNGADPFERAGQSTHAAQLAIYCASLAGYELLGRPDPATAAAGHSLGEISALAAAGAIGERDALSLVGIRGRLMEGCSQPGDCMLALRADAEVAAELTDGIDAWVANENAPGQTVVSARGDGAASLERRARERDVRALRLNIAGAFHSPAMEPARAPFAEALAQLETSEPRFPVFSATTGEPFGDIPQELAAALTSPVRFTSVLHTLASKGARTFVETGPGRVLTGLVRRSFPDAAAVSADPMEMSRA
jgi:acyl transferase domain-containing protein